MVRTTVGCFFPSNMELLSPSIAQHGQWEALIWESSKEAVAEYSASGSCDDEEVKELFHFLYFS